MSVVAPTLEQQRNQRNMKVAADLWSATCDLILFYMPHDEFTEQFYADIIKFKREVLERQR